jgi:hypothetical protein
MGKTDVFFRANRAVEEGELWRAKEMLVGGIGTRGYDLKLFQQLGEVLLQMHDLVEAGKYLFLCGKRNSRYDQAIDLYLQKYHKSLLTTFPRPARLEKLEKLAGYPESVREELHRQGLNSRNLCRFTRKKYCDRHAGTGGGCLETILFVAFTAMMIFGIFGGMIFVLCKAIL